MDGPPTIKASVDELLGRSVTWWRYQGAPYATVILKATVTLVHGQVAVVEPPDALSWQDRTRPSGAIDRADETVPFMAGAAVIVQGNLYATNASPRAPVLARVVVGVDRPVVDKTIAAEKNGRVPLLWEEALLTTENPVGSEEPRIIDPRNASRAAGLGPISPNWLARVHLLPAPIAHNADVVELPNGIDGRFFNAAPVDQQCPFLQGSEAIVLTNLNPKVAEFQSWLPALHVVARVLVDGLPAQTTFALDMLTIDAEAGRAGLVWRAVTRLPLVVKTLTIEAKLGGSFDRTRRTAPAEAPPPPQEPAAPVAPVVRAPAPPTPAPAARVERKLVRLADPKRGVRERIAVNATLDDLDLEGADLHDIDLTGRSFEGSKLDGANLHGARMTGASFAYASLVGADLEAARLDSANFERADLSKAKASKASLPKAALTGAKLVQAVFHGAVLDDADLSDSDATKASFTDAKLRRVKANRANFTQTSLVTADFEYASLDFAVLDKSSLDDASFVGASLADASLVQCVAEGARFSKARLARANLRQARIVSATLSGADFTAANLERADLSGSRLDNACLNESNLQNAKCVSTDFTGASLRDADLRGADLTGARMNGTDRSLAKLEGAKLKNLIE